MGLEKSSLASFMGGTRGFADPDLRKLQSDQSITRILMSKLRLLRLRPDSSAKASFDFWSALSAFFYPSVSSYSDSFINYIIIIFMMIAIILYYCRIISL